MTTFFKQALPSAVYGNSPPRLCLEPIFSAFIFLKKLKLLINLHNDYCGIFEDISQ